MSLWSNPRIIDEYISDFAALDPQLPVVAALHRPTIYRESDHLDLTDPRTREFTNWIKGFGGGHHLTAVVPLGDAGQRACLSIHYQSGDEHLAAAQQRRLAAVFASFKHALELGFRNNELITQAFWNGVTAVEEGRGAILLNERGRVMHLNDAAARLIGAHDGLSYKEGALHCERTAEDAKLAGLIAQATRRTGATAGALRLVRRSGRLPLLITIYPLVTSRRMVAPLEAAAVMTIVDPAESPATRPSLWRTAFSLTGREAEFANLLTSGHSVESAAATLQMAIPTARTHLRNIFQKTGTDRQSGLLQLLSRMV